MCFISWLSLCRILYEDWNASDFEKVSFIVFGRMPSWHNRGIIPQLAETEKNTDDRQLSITGIGGQYMTGHLLSIGTQNFLLCTATGMGDDNGFCGSKDLMACASGPAVKGVYLKPLDCWDCGIKSL